EQLGDKAEDVVLCLAIQQNPLNRQAPNAQGMIDGKPFKLSDSRGKVVVLIFSATWCPSCRALAPHKTELTKRFKDQPFVLLDVDTDKNEPLSDQWGITKVPSIYVIDKKGVIRSFGY